ncbi:hypothetical protein [Sporosalibacterium faouarense]|uniref:hypothetical protein n=1 Tax=Sporosalibacterium faouarense TaxID=516123 RepID=UPI00141C1603|nr:hypothetical protein [Sporosalibacterium faouarense]MTI48561.1 hypothetical protein [Bacillota bacterium]
MKKILSWTIIFCIASYILGSITIPFIAIEIFPFFLGLVFFLGIISSVLLIIMLIFERIKDKEDEQDDLNQY